MVDGGARGRRGEGLQQVRKSRPWYLGKLRALPLACAVHTTCDECERCKSKNSTTRSTSNMVESCRMCLSNKPGLLTVGMQHCVL